ncbi:hypothetical protein RO3G_08502 [Rhizopus delemar RA 99-880]|uniref:Uncharacterized protein n=1 Tax=Rhizopus delemar (strain RA 99-880 / ATCC MYA-4621 / FGSC 9543 / NRRL 43880) TaxID=246409 RepID=I1C5R7_RHIO9|nr:hypothetical protein RO3G_08502 [Rhizopus delemar RA 99-880]|eukprot:EIE83797.1 hypothetical protein RO3G_08502 [Rhizopus delemar RA 99-880]
MVPSRPLSTETLGPIPQLAQGVMILITLPKLKLPIWVMLAGQTATSLKIPRHDNTILLKFLNCSLEITYLILKEEVDTAEMTVIRKDGKYSSEFFNHKGYMKCQSQSSRHKQHKNKSAYLRKKCLMKPGV